MKRCIDAREFSRYIDGMLDRKSMEGLEAHCRDCERCARELDSWKKLKEMLDGVPGAAVPEGFREKVMSRIAGEKILPARPAAGPRQILAAAILFLAALYSMFRPLLRPLLSDVLSHLAKPLSVMMYNFLSAMGIDPALLIRFLGNVMANLQELFPFFIAGTIAMSAVFALLVLGERTARQSG